MRRKIAPNSPGIRGMSVQKRQKGVRTHKRLHCVDLTACLLKANLSTIPAAGAEPERSTSLTEGENNGSYASCRRFLVQVYSWASGSRPGWNRQRDRLASDTVALGGQWRGGSAGGGSCCLVSIAFSISVTLWLGAAFYLLLGPVAVSLSRGRDTERAVEAVA
jgi:hypothetical protein